MRNKKLIATAGMTAALAAGGIVGVAVGSPIVSGAQDTVTSEATTEAPAEATAGTEAGGRHRGPFDLEVAAETLGMSAEDLRTALQDGKTLAEVAEDQGVERQVLIDALVAEGEARLDEAKAALPDRIAELVDSNLPARGEGGPGMGRGGPGGGHGAGLDAAAEALGVTADELRTALRDGQTIAEVAEANDVEVQAVIDAMVAEATEKIADAVAEERLTQEEADERLADLTERITTMVNEGGPRTRMGD